VPLAIPEPVLREIRRQGEEAYPTEGCGVLVGNIGGDDLITVIAAIACTNAVESSSRSRYEIAPVELFRIQRQCRNDGSEIVGFYHSHPDHPAQWSQTDLQEAHWTGCAYVITSVEQGRATETLAFRLIGAEEEKRFEELPVELPAA
jgi:proteasome lid subunit RPN8/RPN11